MAFTISGFTDEINKDFDIQMEGAKKYGLTHIEMRGLDRIGILRDLVQVITIELDVNIRGLQIQSHDGIFEGKISLYVSDKESLSELIEKVQNIKGIERVKRL